VTEKVAHIFTGQGFSFTDIKKLDGIFFPSDVHELYEDIFGCPLTPIDSVTSESYRKNEVSTALLLASSLHWIEKSMPTPAAVAGYSVGQYLALHAAGVLSRHDLISLLFRRCKAMNKAAENTTGAMAAILGLRLEEVEKIAIDQFVSVSNDNAPGNVTVAGEKTNIEKTCEIAIKQGAYKAQILNTSGAWHCPLMILAAEDLLYAISQVTWHPPQIPLIDNVTASAININNIEKQLLSHLTRKVRWRESMQFLSNQGVVKYIEMSHFDLLSKMGPFISRKAQWLSAISCEEN